jgi:hypothetical protein
MPDMPEQCDGFDVVSELIEDPLSGPLTVSVDAGGPNQFPIALLDWQMTVGDATGEWRIEGLTTVNYAPTLQGGPEGFTASQIGSKVFFKHFPTKGRKADMSSGACRVDILMTVVPK